MTNGTTPPDHDGYIAAMPSRSFLLVTGLLRDVGELTAFAGRFFRQAVHARFEWREFMRQCFINGTLTLPLVGITAFIMGLVLTVQSRPTVERFGATSMLPAMVAISVVREIAPVITAIIGAGKIGSSMGAELGSMKVTEQIDAMRALGTDPIQKLVTPRVIAMATVLPLLVIIADFMGVVGGFLISYFLLSLTPGQYWQSVWTALEWNDVAQGLLKPFVFAFAISLVGCFYGLRTTGGTQGVGHATTQAMVVASVLCFILTFFITKIFVSSVAY